MKAPGGGEKEEGFKATPLLRRVRQKFILSERGGNGADGKEEAAFTLAHRGQWRRDMGNVPNCLRAFLNPPSIFDPQSHAPHPNFGIAMACVVQNAIQTFSFGERERKKCTIPSSPSPIPTGEVEEVHTLPELLLGP